MRDSCDRLGRWAMLRRSGSARQDSWEKRAESITMDHKGRVLHRQEGVRRERAAAQKNKKRWSHAGPQGGSKDWETGNQPAPHLCWQS